MFNLKVWCDWDVLREDKFFNTEEEAYEYLEAHWDIDEISYDIEMKAAA
jgi:hypothetical protein